MLTLLATRRVTVDIRLRLGFPRQLGQSTRQLFGLLISDIESHVSPCVDVELHCIIRPGKLYFSRSWHSTEGSRPSRFASRR